MSSLKNKAVKATGWNFAKIMVGQLQSFVVSIFLARLLVPEDFGTVGLALVFANFVEMFVDFGFSNAIVQKQNVAQVQLSTIFWLNFIIGLVLSVVMFLCSGLIAVFFDTPILSSIVKVFSITFIIKALAAVPTAIFQKELSLKKPVVISLISSFLTSVLGIILAYSGFGIWSIVISQVSNWILSTILLWIVLDWRPSFVFQLHEIKDLWRFGYKYSLAGAIDNLFYRLDTLIIGKIFSPITLGLFYRGQSLNNLVIKFAFSSIANVVLSTFSKLKDNIEHLKDSMTKLMHLVTFTTCFFAGIMYLSSEQIIVILFTDKWIDAVPFFKIFSIFPFYYTLPNIIYSSINSIGKSGVVLKIQIVSKVLLMVSIPLGLYFGIYAYIYATLFAGSLGMIYSLYLSSKNIGVSFKSQLLLIFRYLIVYYPLIFSLDYIKISNNYCHIVVVSVIFSVLYVILNMLLKNDGLKYSHRILTDIIKNKCR